LLEKGVKPLRVLDALNETLEEVGRRYERGELFLSHLIMIGYLAKEVSEFLRPCIAGEERGGEIGKVVIGTVRGDIHDIGKNIVIMMLEAAGFEVVDLGVDVPPERFIETVRREKPDILGMSALLTSTMEEMRVVIEALERSGLRDEVKVIVGGRPLTEEYAMEIGADGYAGDSVKAIRVAMELLGRGRDEP
jgi:methylmalonyl-CoA mutase cobalamin-binding domain/chain